MNNGGTNNGIWLDPKSLQHLRQQAATNQESALQSAAEQFEAQFVAQMLEAMRATVPEDGILSGRNEELYQGLMDRQLALDIVRGRGFGLAESISQQMAQTDAHEAAGSAVRPLYEQPEMSLNSGVSGLPIPARSDLNSAQMTALRSPDVLAHASRSAKIPEMPAHSHEPTTPEAFVDEVLPYARQASQELGVRPEILVAQAALETGWGKHVIRHADGRSTFNFFNIKAHGDDWQGAAVARTTFEYAEGIPQRVRDRFRAYDSPQAGFNDYVELVSTRPRYASALDNSGDPRAYIEALQNAGYATDPRYASKVIDLLDHPAITAISTGFKKDADVPTNKSATIQPTVDKTGRG